MKLLEAKNVGISFGGLRAVDNFNLEISENELVGLIGPNGAGKTTVFNMLTGVYAPTDGEITLMGQRINGVKPNKIVKLGMARTFQNIRLFGNLSVLDNIKIALQNNYSYNTLEGIFRVKKYWVEEKNADQKAMELLDVFHMAADAHNQAKNLPYGKQRKLEICRALATDPKVILFDEPAAGMNPQETLELMNTIEHIRERFKVSVLLIEHDMNLVMGICQRLIVLNYGMTIARGTPEQIKTNPMVISAYLGS